jgi:hypothetical protein
MDCLPESFSYLAWGLTVVFTFVLGGLWFGPLFGKLWFENSLWTEKRMSKNKSGAYMARMMLSSVAQYAVGHLFMVGLLHQWNTFNADDFVGTWVQTFKYSFVLFVAFALPIQVWQHLWEGSTRIYFLIVSTNRFVGFVGGALVYATVWWLRQAGPVVAEAVVEAAVETITETSAAS